MAGSSVSTVGMQTNSTQEKNYSSALVILTTLFFMWGFLTCLNDILIPHLKAVFTLNYTEAMLIQFVFFAAYFIVSLPSGWIVNKIGYKSGIVVGLITAGIGTLLFYPAAAIRSYPVFLMAFFVMASGITLLQVAANPYVAILGKPETSSSRLNLTQAFNSLGTTVAPYFGALLILSVGVKAAEDIALMSPENLNTYKLAEAAAVQVPYLGLAVALFILAAVFAMFKLPVIKNETGSTEDIVNHSHDHLHESAWGYKHLILGAIAIFVYVGGEVSIGSFLVNYLGESDIAGLVESEAGKYVSLYWGGAMIGRFFGALTLSELKDPKKKAIFSALVFILALVLAAVVTKEYENLSSFSFSGFTKTATFLLFVVINFGAFNLGKTKPGKTLSILAVVAGILVITSMLTYGQVAMWTILAIGLFNSIMFPTIFTLAIAGLGKYTSQGSGILCMAIVGGAIVPLLQGVLADNIGIHHAFVLPVLCYAYIAFYGIKGSIPEFAK